MKAFREFILPIACLAGLCAGPRALAAGSSTPPAAAGTLQVQIIIPPNWQPLFEDRATEAFITHLTAIFQRQGYEGKIVGVSALDEPAAGCCLLTINLLEWRMNYVGNIDCSFTASLQTERAVRQLGVFSGMGFRWMNSPGRFGFGDTFGDAADDALRQLYFALQRTGLLAGTRKP
jgi:hypothetical protein